MESSGGFSRAAMDHQLRKIILGGMGIPGNQISIAIAIAHIIEEKIAAGGLIRRPPADTNAFPISSA